MHIIELDGPVGLPQDGLLLGNGDLSISVYQHLNRLIWRFGKNDVWDRRLDRSRDPRPPHIDEIARGVGEEGWKCGPYGDGEVVATRGTKDPKRMKELCSGVPPSFCQPYPCPKPVGELALSLPPDLTGMTIRQRLLIEEATLEITCTWSAGVTFKATCFVPPSPNVLVVHWTLEGWSEATRIGLASSQVQPLWFSLYRWPDPTVADFNARYFCENRALSSLFGQKAFDQTPLPPPSTRQVDEQWVIEQAFPPDPLFKDGFRYLLAPAYAPGNVENTLLTKRGEYSFCAFDEKNSNRAENNLTAKSGEARLHLLPPDELREGRLAVSVTTSRDPDGPEEELRRIRGLLASSPVAVMQRWEAETRANAAGFWGKSSLKVAEPLLENAWYETLHARRCAYRADTVTPGLFMPSTVLDYSLWHGDYHTNYNLQSPFFGDNTANHVELGDAFFHAMQYFRQMGKKIAHDYYNCRGVFIQLSGYPAYMEDDALGAVPMGRMAYMTGWVVSHYWWRYRYTMDVEWLRNIGYPAIRDCALFYTDFLKKGADGLYHAFPSNQGEDGFTGDPKDFTDRKQVLQHARYCLRVAIKAAEVLGADAELRDAWRDRLEHCAGNDGTPPVAEDERLAMNPPEFRADSVQSVANARIYLPKPLSQPWPAPGDVNFDWYFGFLSWMVMQEIRAGRFAPDDGGFARFREMINRWRRPNGLFCGMSMFMYGPSGAFTESQAILAPIQELMLQSWDGVIRVFPSWPKHVDAEYRDFRAEGAFLVTAAWSGGGVTRLEIRSERGGSCRLMSPWAGNIRVKDQAGTGVPAVIEPDGIVVFETRPGETYRITGG